MVHVKLVKTTPQHNRGLMTLLLLDSKQEKSAAIPSTAESEMQLCCKRLYLYLSSTVYIVGVFYGPIHSK